jgi:hypothetical protein
MSGDAFGRGRICEPQTLGDYKHTYNNVDDFINVSTSGGAVSYVQHQASVVLTTNTTATSRIIHQTRRYHHYLPGKSGLVLISFNFGNTEVSSTKRIGYFDDLNGIFLECGVNSSGVATVRWVMRRGTTGSPVDVAVAQSDWNRNTCTGGIFNLDTTKTQLIFIDFQWLGVGRVRCGFVHEGNFIIAHEFMHSNVLPTVYWSNPNLPVRSEVQNTAGNSGASLQHICSSVMSEGGYIEAGTDWEIQNTAAVSTALPGGTWTPILCVRLKNSFNGYANRLLFSPEHVSLFADVKSIGYRIGKIPNAGSLTGSPTWTSVNAFSGSEYSVNMAGITLADFVPYGGGFLASGVNTGSQSNSTPTQLTSSKRNFITQNFDSTNSEVFVVLARTLGTGANDQATVWASIQWKEII